MYENWLEKELNLRKKLEGSKKMCCGFPAGLTDFVHTSEGRDKRRLRLDRRRVRAGASVRARGGVVTVFERPPRPRVKIVAAAPRLFSFFLLASFCFFEAF